MNDSTTTLDICTMCADELPGTTPGSVARMCVSCALRFISDCELQTMSNGECVLDADELRDARATAYASLAAAEYDCPNCFTSFFLNAERRQLVHESQDIDCPSCHAVVSLIDVICDDDAN